MAGSEGERVTQLLASAAGGDAEASSALLPLVYTELRRLARARLAREDPGQTLQPTALVHEAYLRLVGPGNVKWNSRGHFFGAAARAMRRILVERARRKGRLKHGGEARRVEWDGESIEAPSPSVDVLSLNEAIERLEARDKRKSEIVHLRFFAGLSIKETAAALDLSPTTVKGEWTFAKAWLRREIRGIGDREAC
ncbi:MAG TPA: ECF-type sigma factor [Planctomycetota bacterium]|jgi:RNA polymerase sigma factor (TIGR02999 family)|nr:ECF-type sigma factor [Planctomycetota bacterium]